MNLIFVRGTESIVIKVINKKLTFGKVQGNYYSETPIDGLKLSVGGILEEFPDLSDLEPQEIRKEALDRFKAHVLSLDNDIEIITYLRDDLKKHGYKLIMIHRDGYRPIKVKDGKF